MNKNKSQISNRPLDPTQDFEEYIGGDASGRVGLSQDHTRESGEDIDLKDEFEFKEDGTYVKDKPNLDNT